MAPNHLLAPIDYLSGGLPWLHLSPTLQGARLSYVSYNNLLISRSLDVPWFNLLEARVSYVLWCTNPLGARVPHISYVNLLIARVSHAIYINLLCARLSYVSYFNILIARVVYVSFINPLVAIKSSVSRINYHYINLSGGWGI